MFCLTVNIMRNYFCKQPCQWIFNCNKNAIAKCFHVLRSRRDSLTLYCMLPPQSLPWSQLWSPPSLLQVWLARFPAPAHSFHCIVSDRKEQNSQPWTPPAKPSRCFETFHSWVPSKQHELVFIMNTLQLWMSGGRCITSTTTVIVNANRRNGAATFVFTVLITERLAQTFKSSTEPHFITTIWLEPCACTLSASFTNV